LNNPYVLENKVALVTGASSGLGRQFALTLARAGAKVALAARRAERLEDLAEEIAGFDGRAMPVSCDVTDLASITHAVDTAEKELGPISILINNSGVGLTKKIVDCEEGDYDFVMDTNLKGAFFVAREVGARMIRHDIPGRIVNIASVGGQRILNQLSIYCMSKAAVIHMTKAMAVEWGRYNINVNAICPGYIETEINRDHWQTEGGQKLIKMLPRRRVGEPQDLDGTLMLLVSDQSRFINGSVITVDDGLSAA
jgi:NAD(P)-dependent dehydrogenase (short-subunit alcohol dehydrogenase family)